MELENQQIDQQKIEEYEVKMKEFYEARLPFIRIKHKHDSLMAEIAEARIRTVQADDAFIQYQLKKEDNKKKAQAEKPVDGSDKN